MSDLLTYAEMIDQLKNRFQTTQYFKIRFTLDGKIWVLCRFVPELELALLYFANQRNPNDEYYDVRDSNAVLRIFNHPSVRFERAAQPHHNDSYNAIFSNAVAEMAFLEIYERETEMKVGNI